MDTHNIYMIKDPEALGLSPVHNGSPLGVRQAFRAAVYAADTAEGRQERLVERLSVLAELLVHKGYITPYEMLAVISFHAVGLADE